MMLISEAMESVTDYIISNENEWKAFKEFVTENGWKYRQDHILYHALLIVHHFFGETDPEIVLKDFMDPYNQGVV
jgi:hypothetical protein